ncbi:hypothetical protein STSO111631_09495 [Stackebrandtia soli]
MVDVDGDGKGDEVIESTAGHAFWTNLTEALNDGAKWVPARDLVSGAWLRTSSGTWVQATALTAETRLVSTYNLSVSQTHTYYVDLANTDALVHNCSDLVGDEAKFPQAHTLKEHVNVSESQAIALARKKGGPNSVFDNVEIAQSVADSAIAGSAKRIARWLRGGGQKLTISGPSGIASLGWMADVDGEISRTGGDFTMILQREKGHKAGYIVYTLFPGRR